MNIICSEIDLSGEVTIDTIRLNVYRILLGKRVGGCVIYLRPKPIVQMFM